MHNTIRLTRACNHANRVSGVNKYIFHVGHPWVLNDTSLDVSLKMLNVRFYTYFVSCVHCSATRYFIHNYEHFGRKGLIWNDFTTCTTQILCTTRTHLPHNDRIPLVHNVLHACIPQIVRYIMTNMPPSIYTHTFTQGHFRHASVLERVGRWREAVVTYLLCLHLGGNDQTVVKAVCKVRNVWGWGCERGESAQGELITTPWMNKCYMSHVLHLYCIKHCRVCIMF